LYSGHNEYFNNRNGKYETRVSPIGSDAKQTGCAELPAKSYLQGWG
jgi:hypothetical protein